MARYELNSASSDDAVIGTVRNITDEALKLVKLSDGTTGLEVLTKLRTETDADAYAEEMSVWSHAIATATFNDVLTKRRTENFVFRSDINDTEALRTPSLLVVVWDEIARNRSFGTVTLDIAAYRAGFLEAIDLIAVELVTRINEKRGYEGLIELTMAVDILNARHHAEGWGLIASAVEKAVATV